MKSVGTRNPTGRWVLLGKPDGRKRRIYVPHPEEKRLLQRALAPLRKLWRLAASRCMRNHRLTMDMYRDAVHGFAPGKSPVTAAIQHVGAAAALSVDLEDFFDHITTDRVMAVLHSLELAKHLADMPDQVFRDGVAAQGLPTSPVLSNIAFLEADARIIRFARSRNLVYTRYADDLVLSSRDPSSRMADLLPDLRRIVEACGFRINPRKTRIQTSRTGRIVICGVGVDRDGIHPTRAARRRLRALVHLRKTRQAEGLLAWCRLTMPRLYARGMLLSHFGLHPCHAVTMPCGPTCTGAAQALEELRRTTDAFTVLRAFEDAVSIHRAIKSCLQREQVPCFGTLLRYVAHTTIPPRAILEAVALAADAAIDPPVRKTFADLVSAMSAGDHHAAAEQLSSLLGMLRGRQTGSRPGR